MYSGDSIRVVHPLFQGEGDGAIPISPLQLEIQEMPMKIALGLNDFWHSRLPQLTNWQGCEAFGAFYKNLYYAVAIWGRPVARAYNGKGYWELRRMAIADDSPKNTASRMIRIMKLMIRKKRPEIVRLISYQDTGVHKGTIYRASGWNIGGRKKNIGTGWNTRKRNMMQTTSDKIRWEYDL